MKNILKKALAVLILVIFTSILNSCGGEISSTNKNLKTYEGDVFTIDIDQSWKVVNKTDFYSEIPDETIVAFTMPESYDGFFINVIIVKEDLKQNVNPIYYARANINLSAQNLTDYKKIQEAVFNSETQKGIVHIFEARSNPTEKLIRFVQFYTTYNNNGYIVTGGMLTDTPKEIRDLVGSMVTSFKFK